MIKREDVVIVTAGPHKGRIGMSAGKSDIPRKEVVYFGSMFFADGHYLIQKRCLKLATMADLLYRLEEIANKINSFRYIRTFHKNYQERYLLFAEYNLVRSTIYRRDFLMRYRDAINEVKKGFIAHSLQDKWFANRLTSDLKLLGHDICSDDIKIMGDNSVPASIQKELEKVHYLIVVLSENANQSHWEKTGKIAEFLEEVENRKTVVIPALLEECEIPLSLKTKKYADFTGSYQEALDQIITAIR